MTTQAKKRGLELGATLLALCVAGPLAAQTPSVTVQNNHHDALKVYLQQKDGPSDMRLGEVGGMATATFTVPSWALEDKHRVGFVVKNENGLVREADAYPMDQGPTYGIMVGHTGRRAKTDDRMWADVAAFGMATTVTVRNEREHERKVFLQRAEHSVELGMVPAHSEMTFAVPESFMGEKAEVAIVNAEGGVLASSALDLEKGRHFGVTLVK